MRAMIAAALLTLGLAGCAPPVTLSGCGVIRDSLKDVQGQTREDQRRIDTHYERGHAAKCWG